MERGHGRLERRACTIMRGTNGIRDQFAPDRCWAALGCAVRRPRARTVRGHTTRSVCYYISSRPVDTEARLELVRGHWGVENSLHRTLDVQFRGDNCRLRTVQQNSGADVSISLLRDRIGRHPWILAATLP